MTTSEIRIIRSPKDRENPYAQIRRDTLQDRNLSWAARGVIAYLLSKPGDWVVQPHDLEQGCGRDKVYSVLNELIKKGYLVRYRHVDENQRVIAWTYEIHEEPLPASPDLETPDEENPDITKKREEQTTESTNSAPSGAIKPSSIRGAKLSFWKTVPVDFQPVEKEKPVKSPLIQYLEGRLHKQLGKGQIAHLSQMVGTQESPDALFAKPEFQRWVHERVTWYLGEPRDDKGLKFLLNLLRKYEGPYGWNEYEASVAHQPPASMIDPGAQKALRYQHWQDLYMPMGLTGKQLEEAIQTKLTEEGYQ